jgi:hypothetical protein
VITDQEDSEYPQKSSQLEDRFNTKAPEEAASSKNIVTIFDSSDSEQEEEDPRPRMLNSKDTSWWSNEEQLRKLSGWRVDITPCSKVREGARITSDDVYRALESIEVLR